MKRILYVQYTNPAGYPPLEHSSRMLADKGWEVLFLGVGALGAGAFRFPPHANIEVRQRAFSRPGWQQKLHYLGFCFWVVLVVLRWRPRWVYASDLLACPVSVLVSWIPGVRVLYHEHDSPEESSKSNFKRFLLWCRRATASRAKICVLPNERRVQRFTSETGATDVFCVWNCPRREEVLSEHVEARTGHQELYVHYHGSIVPVRLPMTVLQALAMLPQSVRLRVIGYETIGHQGYIQELKHQATRLGVSDRVEFLGAMNYRQHVLGCGRNSDIGLALTPTVSRDINLDKMVGASNKPFDCMACGLPLLVSDLPEWREVYVEPRYARTCIPEDPASIADALRWFLEHPEERQEMGDRAQQRISLDWNYEEQFAPTLRQITECF